MSVALLVAILLSIGLYQLLRPPVATRLVLDQLGRSLGLHIAATGTAGYSLRGTPTLTIRDVVASEPGDSLPLLRADRIYVALPWSTLRALASNASTPTIALDRVEIDHPVINESAVRHWLAQRPQGKTRLLTLRQGLLIQSGAFQGNGWSISGFALAIPSLLPDEPVRAATSGRYRSAGMQVPFGLQVALSHPSSDAAFGIVGHMSIERDGWQLPSRIMLSGVLHATGAPRVTHATLAVDGQYRSDTTRAPFTLGAAGELRWNGARFTLSPFAAIAHGSGPIPEATLHGALALSQVVSVDLDGTLLTWPKAWPALPAPIDASTSPLAVAIQYSGTADFHGPMRLQVQRDATRFDAQLRIADMSRWIAASNASPLPPLTGTLQTPELDIAGMRLQGVSIEAAADRMTRPPAP